jgi:hypothetical protein
MTELIRKEKIKVSYGRMAEWKNKFRDLVRDTVET